MANQITGGIAVVGKLHIKAAGRLRIGAVEVTATGTEIEKLAGVTAGTTTASKVLVVGANKNLDVLALPVSGLKIGAGAGTAMDATAAELNVNTAVVAGTSSASKTAVLGANKNLDILALPVSGLKIGTGAGTAMDRSAAELNLLGGKPIGTHGFVIGAEAANVINVGVTLKDGAGATLAVIGAVTCWFSDSATTGAITPTVLSGGAAIGTNGAIVDTEVTGKKYHVVSNAAGLFDLNVTDTAARTVYLVIENPLGGLLISGAITFA